MKTITRDDVKNMNEMEDKDFILVNVLDPEAFKKQYIRTSINIPVSDDNFVERVRSVNGGKDRAVIVYCASAECDASTKAAEALDEAGFDEVYDYEGGTKDWFEKKYAA